MKFRGTLLVVCIALCYHTQAQLQDLGLYQQRKVEIDSAMAAEDYKTAAPLLQAQITELVSTSTYDSLFNYVYDYGKVLWETKNAATAIDETTRLLATVLQYDADSLHWLDALKHASNMYYETGETEKRNHVDRQYLELAEQCSRASHLQKSTGHYNLGFNYLEAGRSEEAVFHFRKSVEVIDTNDRFATSSLVNGYNALGAGLWRNGDLVGAKATFNTCLHYINQLEDEYEMRGNKSNCLSNLSLIHQDEGQLVTAKKILLMGIEERKKAIEIGTDPFQNDQHQRMLISNFRNLASIYLNMGDFSRALNITEQLQKMQRKIYAPDHPSVAMTDESFGSIYLGMGELTKAREYINRYIAFCNDHYGRESFITADGYKRLGDIFAKDQDFNAAIEALGESIAIFEVISSDGMHQSLPGCYTLRSWCHQNLGDIEQALSDNQRVIQLYRQQRTANDPKLGESYLARTKIYRAFNQNEMAEKAIDSALYILRNYRKELRKNNRVQAQDPVLFLPEAYFEKASLAMLKAKNDNSSQIAQYLDSAIVILRNSKAIYEGEDAQLELYGGHQKVFESAQDICFKQYSATGDVQFVYKMLALNEESRTLLLRSQLKGFGSVQFFGVPDSIVSQEHELLAQLNGRVPLKDSTADYQQLELQYAELKNYISTNYPDYYHLQIQENTADVDDVRAELLGNDHTLLQYIVTSNHLYALLITPTAEHLVELPAAGMTRHIEQFNHFITQLEIEPFAQVSAALYRMLIEPVENLITTTNVLIVPDEQLFSINFETLIRPAQSARLHYLLYDYNISYLLSATTAVHFQQLNRHSDGSFLAFAPGFSDQLKQQYVQQNIDSLSFDDTYLHYLQQPFAVRSAQNVAGIMAGSAFTGAQATERQFKDQADKYRIIHLGTHTQINNTSPMLSRLILAKDSKAQLQPEDGYLHAYEIYNLPMRAELAVLTACETGVGTEHPTEGVLSLSQSFAYAGCPSIVMSLWQIDEKTSSGIIEDFYRHLTKGETKSEALRRAKLAYLDKNKGELSAPYFWAGMVLVGNTGPLSEAPTPILWIGAAMLIVVFIAGIVLKRRRKRS